MRGSWFVLPKICKYPKDHNNSKEKHIKKKDKKIFNEFWKKKEAAANEDEGNTNNIAKIFAECDETVQATDFLIVVIVICHSCSV